MATFGPIDTLNLESKRSWVENPDYYIQEKIDGSQFSFTLDNGELKFYNKRKPISKNKVFTNSVNSITALSHKVEFNPDYVYHGEAISKMRHNVIAYSRVPSHNFILFEIYSKSTGYLKLEASISEAKRLGLEMVQTLYQNQDPEVNPIAKCLELIEKIEKDEIESCLGGRIEGVVLKHLHFKTEKNTIVATKLKLVAHRFRESLPARETETSFIEQLASKYKTEARWRKTLQHLRETLPLDGTDNDIMREFSIELKADFIKEHEAEVKELLWLHFQRDIMKYISDGSLEWLKGVLESE